MTIEQAKTVSYKVETGTKGLACEVSITDNIGFDKEVRVVADTLDESDLANLKKIAGKLHVVISVVDGKLEYCIY